MDIVRNRAKKLRAEISKISSNRGRLDHLKDYYKGKTAIIIATGPGFQDYVDLIKQNINENTIIICIKQSLKCFDNIADFHIMNTVHYEKYNYVDPKPITLMTAFPGRRVHPCGDINFFLHNIKGIEHKQVNNWNLNDETYMPNDKNIGPGENMVVNWGHIMMETTLPLCVQLGVKTIIINGWVGGQEHGIQLKRPLNWANRPRLYKDQQNMIRQSKKLPEYFKKTYGIDIYTICESQYQIERITKERFVDIVNAK